MPKSANTPRRNPLAAMEDDLDLVYGRSTNPDGVENGQTTREIAVDVIHPNPFQPRHQFKQEALDTLAASIGQRGIIQPLVVTFHNDQVICIAGERRLRAARQAGLPTVPCIVRENLNDEDLADLALVENIHRQDLTPIEEARAIQGLMTRKNFSIRQAADWLHMKHATVHNRLRLIEFDEIAAAVENGRLETSAAVAIVQFIRQDGNEALRNEVLDQLREGQTLTTEQIARASGKPATVEATPILQATSPATPLQSQTEPAEEEKSALLERRESSAEADEPASTPRTTPHARPEPLAQGTAVSPKAPHLAAAAGTREEKTTPHEAIDSRVTHLQEIQGWIAAQDWTREAQAGDLHNCMIHLQQIGQQIAEAVETIQQKLDLTAEE